MSIIWIAFEVIINFYEGFMKIILYISFCLRKQKALRKTLLLLHCVSVRSDY